MTLEKLDQMVILSNASIFRRFDYSKVHQVFYPKNEKDIVDAILFAKKHNYSIVAKGGGSGLSGACTGGNYDRIFISTYALNHIHEINAKENYIWADAGLTPDQINAVLKNTSMRFNVAPSSKEVATVGGLLNTDGGGNDALIYGTMRDNVLAAEVFDENGQKYTVTHTGCHSTDEVLNTKLLQSNLTLNDVASSHGTLGFISRLKLKILRVSSIESSFGLLKAKDLNDFGSIILSLIQQHVNFPYAEAITYTMPEMKVEYPVLIVQIPKSDMEKVQAIASQIEILTKDKFNYWKDIRVKYPKSNPLEGTQVALFEDFGISETELPKLREIQDEIHQIIGKFGFKPFGKYGHAPSKWYSEDNQLKMGYIMHSREVPLRKISAQESIDTIIALADLCDRLKLTPKPEHKWVFMPIKRKRLEEIRNVLGKQFNPWLMNISPEMLKSFV